MGQPICLLLLCLYVMETNNIMLRRECPVDETHKSCTFYEEYACWVKEDRLERVKTPPKRLSHCNSGCFCKKGLVRAYPGGKCIVAAACRNRKLLAVLEKLPRDIPYF